MDGVFDSPLLRAEKRDKMRLISLAVALVVLVLVLVLVLVVAWPGTGTGTGTGTVTGTCTGTQTNSTFLVYRVCSFSNCVFTHHGRHRSIFLLPESSDTLAVLLAPTLFSVLCVFPTLKS